MGRKLGHRFGPGKLRNPPPPATKRSSQALREWSAQRVARENLMKRVIRKAAEVVTVSAGLYRELAISALRLVPGRR